MSMAVADASELIDDDRVLMAAAKIAAMIRPENPAGISSTMNLAKTSSVVAKPS